jgi:hypothetical protein
VAPNFRADPSGTRPRDLIATTRTTACTDLLTGLHLARRAILVPAPVVAEVGYLLARAGGA